MTIEERIDITWKFLEALDAKGLLGKVNSKLLNDEFTKNFPISAETAGRVFNTIMEQTENGIIDLKASHEEMMMFVGVFGVNLINSYLEYIKKLLKIPLNRNKISYDDKTMYGQLINNICSKLGWDEARKEVIRQNFFVDYRNAISHVDYYVTGVGIFFKIKNKTMCLNIDQFTLMVNEIKAVIDTLQKFIIKKTKELEKQADDLDKKTDELKRQTTEIKKEITERQKKTLAIRNEAEKLRIETKRKERDIEKINKNTEMMKRLKIRTNRNNAKIISKAK